MDHHKYVTYLLLIIGLSFLGCGKTYVYSENYNFLKDMTSALEQAGKAVIFVDQTDLEVDIRFEKQIDELNAAIALMDKYKNTQIPEIFDAQNALKRSLINIRDINADILEAYHASLATSDADTLFKFEELVKGKSKEIISDWQTLGMTVLHSSHVMLEHNKKYNSDSDRLPFRITDEEKKLLKKRFDDALKVFNDLKENSGKNSHQIILELSQYVGNLQILLNAESYGDMKEIHQKGIES